MIKSDELIFSLQQILDDMDFPKLSNDVLTDIDNVICYHDISRSLKRVIDYLKEKESV